MKSTNNICRNIHDAVDNNHINCLKIMLSDDLNKSRIDKDLLLHYVISQEHNINITKLIIDAGANVNIKDKHNISPLYKAMSARNIEYALLLLQSGANINIKNVYGDTCLHRAVECSKPDYCTMLINWEQISTSEIIWE